MLRLTLAPLLFAWLGLAPALAQGPPPVNSTWLTLQGGPSNAGLLLGIEGTHRWHTQGVSLRGLATLRFHFLHPQVESFRELGLLYGLHLGSGSSFLALKVGPALYGYSAENFNSQPGVDVAWRPSLAWEVQVVGRLAPDVGIGGAVLGNVNGTKTLWGLGIGIHLGV